RNSRTGPVRSTFEGPSRPNSEERGIPSPAPDPGCHARNQMNRQLGRPGKTTNAASRWSDDVRPASPTYRARPEYAGVVMPDLTISSTLHSAGRVLALSGEIDMATEHNFQEAVTEALVTQPHGRVVLDCTDLRFIDSSRLRVLFRAHKTAKS